jgi:hypothetical protein
MEPPLRPSGARGAQEAWASSTGVDVVRTVPNAGSRTLQASAKEPSVLGARRRPRRRPAVEGTGERHIGAARLAPRTGADRDPTAGRCCIAVPQTAILVVVNDRGALIDRATQTWVQATGQEVDLHEHRWLAGPTGDVTVVADDWLGREAHRLNGSLVVEGGGLLPDFSALSGDDFNPSGLARPIIDFYERTAECVWKCGPSGAAPPGRSDG